MNAPKPPLSREEVKRIDFALKQFLWLGLPFLLFIEIVILPGGSWFQGSNKALVGCIVLLVLFGTRLYFVVQFCTVLNKAWGWTLFASLMQFLPCYWFLFPLQFVSESIARLRQCGIRVGLFGAYPSDVANYNPPMNEASGGT